MANHIRRLVSGDKVRFKDGELNLELGKQVFLLSTPARRLKTVPNLDRLGIPHRSNHYHGLPCCRDGRSLP